MKEAEALNYPKTRKAERTSPLWRRISRVETPTVRTREEAQIRFDLQVVTYNIGRPAFGKKTKKKKKKG
jgi:hypothetical protein